MKAQVVVVVEHTITIEVADPEALARVTGPAGDEWRSALYPLYSEGDVLMHWAHNAAVNGIEDVSRLDGWADMPTGAVTMRSVAEVDDAYIETKEAPR